MEVWANGLVCYYEVPPPTTSSTLDAFVDSTFTTAPDNNKDYVLDVDNEEQNHSKSPKCTLWIHHARIIDVTTLRDMHVGLPRGTFGFLFHGHRMDQDDLVDPFLFATDFLRGDTTNYPGLTTACQGNANVSQPRDFLCAVSTLEEAQSWVITLQWAASMGRDNAYSAAAPWAITNSTTSTSSRASAPLSPTRTSITQHTDESSCSWEYADGMSTASSYSSLTQVQQQHQQQKQQFAAPVSPLSSRTPAKSRAKSPGRTSEKQQTQITSNKHKKKRSKPNERSVAKWS
jgi:hypothetical protein